MPRFEVESVRRYEFEEQRVVDAQEIWGSAPDITKLRLERRRSGNLSMRFNFKTRFGSRGGSHSISARGEAEQLRGPGRGHGRSRFSRGARYLLFIPWETKPEEMGPWSQEAYANWMVRTLMARPGTSRGGLVSVMSDLPLARLVDAPLLVEFREWAAEPQRASLMVAPRLAAGDPDALADFDGIAQYGTHRTALNLAFMQLGDPELRGRAGWILVAPDSDGLSVPGRPDREFIVAYDALVKSGEVVVPGDAGQKKRRTEALADMAAYAHIGGALLTVVAAACAILVISFAGRRVALKLAV